MEMSREFAGRADLLSGFGGGAVSTGDMGTKTDNELVEASRRGELDAFGQLVARYQDVVCAVSYSSTGDRALSEDVAQDTFVAAWRRLDRVRAGSLRPWLCAIARNLGRKARRRTRREEPIDGDAYVAPGTSPLDALVRADTERIVRDALARVPEKYREVLVLYYGDNQSIRDVAETLGIREDAVMQRLSRGRRYLADGVAALVETSLRGTRPRRDLVAAVLAMIAAIALPSRVDAHSRTTKGSTMLKLALAGSALIAAGTTVYLVRSHDSAPAASVSAAPSATAPLHYGAGAARRPALGPTAPVHPSAARTTTVDDLGLLPADAQFVVGVDLARLKHSPAWQLLIAPAIAAAPGPRRFAAECGFDPLTSLTSVTVGVKSVEHESESGSIVIHGLPKAETMACVAKVSAKDDTLVRMDGDVLLTVHHGDPVSALTFLDDSTALLVFGADATKDGITRIASGRGGSGAAGYSDLIREINTDDPIWLAAGDDSTMLAQLNRELAEFTSIRLHGVYGSIDVTDGLVLNAGARTGSPEMVAKLVSQIQHRLDPLVASGEVGKQFEQLDINADGSDVIVSIAMTTSQLLARAGKAHEQLAQHHGDHGHPHRAD
jgi:RNA polymerase sigma factor (sigma-70 family)